jgi:hypothetical protein
MILLSIYFTFGALLYLYDKYDLEPYCLWIFPISNTEFKYGGKGVSILSHVIDMLLHLTLILSYLDSIGVINIIVKIS